MTETYTKGVMKEDGEPLFMFDTDNDEFARGFEAGGIFLQLALNPNPFEAELQDANWTMFVRMADALDRAYVSEAGGSPSAMKVRVMPKLRPHEPNPFPRTDDEENAETLEAEQAEEEK
jgi:hypothetical protein